MRAVWVLVLLAGCAIDRDGRMLGPAGERDAGPARLDVGPPRPDVGPIDAGPPPPDVGAVDAGPRPPDTGPPPMDGGPRPPDAGPRPRDAGPPDSGPPDTGPPPPDAGPPCPGVLGAACRWTWRMRISIDNTGRAADLVDFPILVALDRMDVDYARTRDAGEDLRFLDATLGTVLSHETELWLESGTSLVWVRVPRVTARAVTDIWMYYGHPSAADAQDAPGVWRNGYTLVWHLSRAFTDSSGDGHGGRNMGTTDAAGFNGLGRGRAFSGSAQWIDSSYSDALATMTVEAWTFGAADPRADRNVGIAGRNENYQLNWDHFGAFRAAFGLRDATSWQSAAFLPVSGGRWYYLAGTYDGDVVRAYRDGAQTGMNNMLSGPPAADTFPMRVGTNPDPASGWFFAGSLDEIRISNVVRPPSWIDAQYASMTGTLTTYGVPEPVAP